MQILILGIVSMMSFSFITIMRQLPVVLSKNMMRRKAELKRVFSKKEYRGMGLAGKLIAKLEENARGNGFETMILETGKPLVAAGKLYEKSGYKRIPNYGQYADMPDSVCMSKSLI